MAPPHVIDYDAFLPRLVSGLRQEWEDVRQQRPDETFYMFGIATDSDVVVLTPFWNTEEQYARRGASRQPFEKWLVPEHGYQSCPYTAALQDEVNRYVFEKHGDEPESVFEKRKARLLKIFEQALVQLDKEGFFGTGKERHRVLLAIDRGDCGDDEARWMLKVIRRINPRQSWVPFVAALKQERKRVAALEREKQREAAPIKVRAIEFLRQEKRRFDRYWHASRVRQVTPFLAGVMGEDPPPEELWEVCFEARGEPNGRLHGPGVLLVLVNPKTGKCVIAP